MAAARFSVFSHAFRRRTESNGTGCGEKKCFLSRMKNFLLHKNRRKEGKCTQSGVCFKVGNKNIILLTAI